MTARHLGMPSQRAWLKMLAAGKKRPEPPVMRARAQAAENLPKP
jgi:hypothetical protein